MGEDNVIPIALSIVSLAVSVVWSASRIKATVDTHGNAIGELKQKMEAHTEAIQDHHGRLARIEGERNR